MPGPVVVVIAYPGGGEVGEAQAYDGHPRREISDLAVNLCPDLRGSLGIAYLELAGPVHLAVNVGVAEVGAASGVGGIGRAERRAPEEQVEEVGCGGIVRDPASDGGLNAAAGVVYFARERGLGRIPGGD